VLQPRRQQYSFIKSSSNIYQGLHKACSTGKPNCGHKGIGNVIALYKLFVTEKNILEQSTHELHSEILSEVKIGLCGFPEVTLQF
jgi:hypothetical protein